MTAPRTPAAWMILLALSHIKIHAYGVDDLRFPFLILFPYLVTSNERYRVISGKRRRERQFINCA
jgi:hypothetical protein